MKNGMPKTYFFGHHKCATTWFSHYFSLIGDSLGWRQCNLDSPYQFDGCLESWLQQNFFDHINYTNADWRYVEPLVPGFRGVHIVRDPRDILVSAYFSHKNSHPEAGWPELEEHRNSLRECSEEEGLMLTLQFLSNLKTNGWTIDVFGQMMNWDYDQENIFEVRFEDLAKDPYGVCLKCLDHLGVLDSSLSGVKNLSSHVGQRIVRKVFGNQTLMRRIPKWHALEKVELISYERLTGGRSRGEEDQSSHYRKGTSGDWISYFTPDINDAFVSLYPGLLNKLGYENGRDG